MRASDDGFPTPAEMTIELKKSFVAFRRGHARNCCSARKRRDGAPKPSNTGKTAPFAYYVRNPTKRLRKMHCMRWTRCDRARVVTLGSSQSSLWVRVHSHPSDNSRLSLLCCVSLLRSYNLVLRISRQTNSESAKRRMTISPVKAIMLTFMTD